MTRDQLRVAVAGAGLMGRWHAYFAAKAGATVVAVIDPDIEAAGRLARRFRGAIAAAALERALDEHAIDVVHVCTPTSTHFALAQGALSRQTHVLLEKPMTAAAAETEALVSMARSHGLLINPVHQCPLQRGFRRLRLDLGRLGQPVRIVFNCCTAGGCSLTAADRLNLLIEILPHPLSLFYRLFGERVFDGLDVVSTTAGSDVEIAGTLHDARISATVSLRGRPTDLSLHYLGTSGSGYVDLFHGFYVAHRGHTSQRAKLTRPFVRGASLLAASGLNLVERTARSEWAYPGLLELIRQFYRSVRSGQQPPIDEEEVRGTARALDRFRSSIGAAAQASTSPGR